MEVAPVGETHLFSKAGLSLDWVWGELCLVQPAQCSAHQHFHTYLSSFHPVSFDECDFVIWCHSGHSVPCVVLVFYIGGKE